MDIKSCCFIGHREIDNTKELTLRITNEIKTLINEGVTRFLFGSRSNFNTLCYEITTQLKKQFPFIIRIAYDTKHENSLSELERHKVERQYQAVTQNIINLFGYEEIYKPEKSLDGGKASYIERNQAMIDDSDVCIFYYDDHYTPKQMRISNKSIGGIYTSKNSGTAIAFKYATQKSKRIINVFKTL